MPMRQLPLDLQFLTAQGRDDFIIGDSNRLAATMIDRWPDWPGQFRAVNLVGPPASGKGHLAAIWREQSGARSLAALADWRPQIEAAHYILESPRPGSDWPDEPLFHLLNRTTEDASSLLILSPEPVAGLAWRLPDLVSRMRALNLVRLERPDDALLCRLLEKYFADRQLAVSREVVDYMVGRMERSFLAVQTIAAAMDRRALAERRNLTLPLAREIMAEFADGVHSRQSALPTKMDEQES
jgi:chromosomal replication initiation ATPase DnaA